MTQNLRQIFSKLASDNKGRESRSIRGEDDSGGSASIYVYDIIDPFWGISAAAVVEVLNSVQADNIKMHINSPGGDVFEARAIVSAMRNSGKVIDTVVDGLAASSASWIATAGDSVSIADGAFMMIHESWTLQMGNADDFEHSAGVMRKIDDSIVNDYAKRTNGEPETILQQMKDETWFTAEEAVEQGFADTILTGEKVSNSSKWNLSAYENAPKEVINQYEQEQQQREVRNRRIAMLLQSV